MIVWDYFAPPKDRRLSTVPAPCGEIILGPSQPCQLGNTQSHRLECAAALGVLVTVWIEDDFPPVVKRFLLE